jgi:AmmeMemoRadiSam system protein B
MVTASIRPAAVAGLFYPDKREQLNKTVRGLLSVAQTSLTAPKALIAPHAGYIYSGPVAASAYARLLAARGAISRVVLLGPSHRVPFQGLAVSSAAEFETPLGRVPVDHEAVERINGLPQVQVVDQAHAREHSLEVHLPFLQTVLNNFTLIPLVVGDAPPREVSEVLEQLWGGPETVIIVSSDLSHYHDYETAIRMDSATSRAIEALRPEDIEYDHACGRNPINGLLCLAREKGMQAETLDLRNSGDTAGPRDQVVGYGAYAQE